MTCRTVKEHVISGSGKYAEWLVRERGWRITAAGAVTDTANWHELRGPSGAHAGASPSNRVRA